MDPLALSRKTLSTISLILNDITGFVLKVNPDVVDSEQPIGFAFRNTSWPLPVLLSGLPFALPLLAVSTMLAWIY